MADLLSDSMNKIKIYEMRGIGECVLPSTKIIRGVLEVLKNNGYVDSYEEFKDGKFTKLRVKLAKKINEIGTIKPRYAVRIDEYQKFESQYIPSKDFGLLIVSTPKGIMSNREAKEKHVGGKLLAYVY
ncbi:MAG: 30S ribosomal protein S8 [Candidatus Micrarchaeaceae archaeon]